VRLAWAREPSNNAQAAREPSRAACGMNCQRFPVPFITCADNKSDMQRVPARILFLQFELLD